MNDPFIRVVIPVYNGSANLAEAVQSVLTQTLPPAEIIVVDDGSTDHSAEVARRFGGQVVCLRIDHMGASAARNRGVEYAGCAQGEFLAFLDADDLWIASKLQKQVEILLRQPDLDIVLGQVENFISEDVDQVTRLRLAGSVGVYPGYHVGATLIRRASFLQVGYFDESLRAGEFIDWWSRAMSLGLSYQMIDDLVMRRRLHGNNQTLLNREHLRDYTRVARAALDRRRSSPGDSREDGRGHRD
jgi:glycosyltransferase involved in cell wall biosynthesis